MTNEKTERVEQDISFWLDREKSLKELFRNDIINEKHFLQEKLRYFNTVQNRHQGNITEGEKILLNVLKGEIKKLEQQLYPNPIIRLLIRGEKAIKSLLEEKRMIKALNKMKVHPLSFNQRKLDNNLKVAAGGVKEDIKSDVAKEMKQKELQGETLRTGPLKDSVADRNTISAGPLRNRNAESINNGSSKLKEEGLPKKQLRHRLH